MGWRTGFEHHPSAPLAKEIADSFGIQKFSLLRVLADFAKQGAIKVNGREITILDRSKLK
jgi:CRP-like cAMP-binding protein